MPENRSAYEIRVGAFVLSALVLLFAGLLWITGSWPGAGGDVPYRVFLLDSGGLAPGDPVHFAGVRRGRIEEVSLRSERDRPVEMRVSLDADVPVRSDSRARVASHGFLGDFFLQIEPGSPDAPPLDAGGRIRGERQATFAQALQRVDALSSQVSSLLSTLEEQSEQLTQRVGTVLTRVESLLAPETVADAKRVLEELRRVTEDVAPRIRSMADQLEAASRSVERGMEPVPEATESASELLADLRAVLGPDGERLSRLLDGAERSFASAESGLGVLTDNRDELGETLQRLREVMENLQSFSRRLEERPHLLLGIDTPQPRKPGGESR